MTLTTRLRIFDPLNPEEAFKYAAELVSPEPWREYRYGATGPGSMRAVADQGRLALIWLHHAVDGPLHDEDHEELTAVPTPYLLEVCWDTGYSYRAANGAGCSDLHAWIVSEYGDWLDQQGLRWMWQNEFTGEWHVPEVDPDGRLGDATLGDWRPPGAAYGLGRYPPVAQ